ncbi:MAG: class I SAM-dependent methyltransferase [Solirubrobacteraceae bacterium]
MSGDPVLIEQVDYYRQRAAEYDRWWLRQGRFDRGADVNARWFAETAALEDVLDRFDPRGRVLELAGGTGLWTRHLAPRATELTVVDAAPEVLEINRARVADDSVRYSTGQPVRMATGAGVLRRVRVRVLALARPGDAVRVILGNGCDGARAGRPGSDDRQRAHGALNRRRPPTPGRG